MQNQQVISRIYELENELKKIKALIQKKPVKKTGLVWGKINFLDSQIEEAKTAVFDFDIGDFVDEKDVASWK